MKINNSVFIHVRPGFEGDAFKELLTKASKIVDSNKIILNPAYEASLSDGQESGFVHLSIGADVFANLRSQLKWRDLIFARQLLWSAGSIEIPRDGDRVSVINDAIQKILLPLAGCNAFSGFELETSEGDEAKELSKFCKSLSRPLENMLNKSKLLPKGKGASHLPRLVLVMTSPSTVWLNFADVDNSSSWPMGIPRLKFPSDAPSRSTLKLEEAFIVLMGQTEISENLREGMTSVDLGACPGGWTYQMVSRGISVVAIDNGQIDKKLMETGLVEHIQEDAFRYRPTKPVDWLVCDVVEQPAKISELMSLWFCKKWCRFAIFNLKLPMNLRWEESQSCLNAFKAACRKNNISVELRAKQLYHDRKEITVFAKISS